MTRFFPSSSILGVDIGTSSIKIAEIEKDSPKPRLKNYGVLDTYEHLSRPNSAIQTNSLKIAEKDTAELLKKLIKEAGFGAKEAVASIPSFSVFTTLLEIPKMSDIDINKTMSFQVRQHIPLPVSEVEIEWLKVGEREEETGAVQQIFIISIPKEIIKRYQNIFALAGLNLEALELESLSLIRALINNSASQLVVDIGALSTNILISDNGFLKANVFSDFGGAALTRSIANGLGISFKRAEELKKQKGLTASGGDYELSTLPQVFLDAIIKETAKAKENHEKNGGRKIERIILAGGGAKLAGIAEYFGGQMGLPASIGNSLSAVAYRPEIELLVKDLGPELAVAIGLGIKNFI
ncbi:MAG: type IV pilus assembly protein PilM [Patescibacteria group bacterium]